MATQEELCSVMNTLDVYDANEMHDAYLDAKEAVRIAAQKKAEAASKK